MRKISTEELKEILNSRNQGEQIVLENCLFEDMDLSGWDLHGINFDGSDFRNVILNHANMSGITAKNAFFNGSTLEGANLSNSDLSTADFRGVNLRGADIRGAEMYASALYRADQTGIITDETTKHYHMRCPETGAFIAWKVCFGRRIVQLLIPADARRIQGTTEEVKCEKAKVLTIKSADFQEQYEEAHSYVDENFVYRRGEMVYAVGFTGNRFEESGGGIHVWLERDAAIAYLG